MQKNECVSAVEGSIPQVIDATTGGMPTNSRGTPAQEQSPYVACTTVWAAPLPSRAARRACRGNATGKLFGINRVPEKPPMHSDQYPNLSVIGRCLQCHMAPIWACLYAFRAGDITLHGRAFTYGAKSAPTTYLIGPSHCTLAQQSASSEYWPYPKVLSCMNC